MDFVLTERDGIGVGIDRGMSNGVMHREFIHRVSHRHFSFQKERLDAVKFRLAEHLFAQASKRYGFHFQPLSVDSHGSENAISAASSKAIPKTHARLGI